MAFTATISSITTEPDPTGTTIQFRVGVAFADSASSYASSKVYIFPGDTTQSAAVAQITGDGQLIKGSLGTLSNLSSKVGTVITI